MEAFEGLLHQVWAAAAQNYETGLDVIVEADGSLGTASRSSEPDSGDLGDSASATPASPTVTEHVTDDKNDNMDTIISTPASSVLEETFSGSLVSLV